MITRTPCIHTNPTLALTAHLFEQRHYMITRTPCIHTNPTLALTAHLFEQRHYMITRTPNIQRYRQRDDLRLDGGVR